MIKHKIILTLEEQKDGQFKFSWDVGKTELQTRTAVRMATEFIVEATYKLDYDHFQLKESIKKKPKRERENIR